MKWGILATGTIARKFADTVNHMDPEAEKLIACASRNLEHGKAFAEKYGIPKVYGSYGEMMTDSEVEAVYIATPNNLHYENCRMCLEAGKHVLCEKPFTLSTEQAQELFDLADVLVARTPVSEYPETLQKHAEWAQDILARHPELNGDTVHLILQNEVGHVFAQVLADAGVYKMDEAGRAGFVRFLASVQ